MGDAEYTKGPYRSGRLTPPPKVPFNWKPIREFLLGCLQFSAILASLSSFFFFVFLGGERIQEAETNERQARNRTTTLCVSFCQEEEYQYWDSSPRFEPDMINCICARAESHRSQRFLCRVASDSPMVCVYN